jgi:hypothetical protein
MHFNNKFFQRAILAFTAGLFLACSARMSAAQQPSAEPNGVVISAPGSGLR